MHSSSPKSLRVIKRPPRSHRCLERLALERGLSSLPQGLPPNRLLLHAWKELENWDRGPPVNDVEQEIVPDENLTREEDKPIELVLHLPRYSWVTLGTILMRASQEGVSYGRSLPGTPRHVWSTVSVSWRRESITFLWVNRYLTYFSSQNIRCHAQELSIFRSC